MNVCSICSKSFTDFYIPKLNLIVEVKSYYTMLLDKNLLLKEQTCRTNGFKYIRIVNNNFEEFDKYLRGMNYEEISKQIFRSV